MVPFPYTDADNEQREKRDRNYRRALKLYKVLVVTFAVGLFTFGYVLGHEIHATEAISCQ